MGQSVPKNTTQTTVTDIPASVKPYVTALLGGNFNDLMNMGYGSNIRDYNRGYSMSRERAILGSPTLGAANAEAMKVLGGDYLKEGNPYLQDRFKAMSRPITEQYMSTVAPGISSQFAQGGRSYSPSMAAMAGRSQDMLGRNLSEVGLGLTAEDYGRERGYMQDMTKFAPSLAQMDYMDSDKLMQLGLMENPEYQQKFNRTQQLMQLLGVTPQGGGTVTGPSGYGNNTGSAIAGAATSAFMTYLLGLL